MPNLPARPTVTVLLPGYAITSDAGHPAFCGVFLIEGANSEGRLTRILVDPAHVGRRPILTAALEARGLSADDIDLVVLTHAHWDHVQNVDVFPEAEVLIHPTELAYASAPHVNDWATPAWTGAMLGMMRLREVAEGDILIPGVSILDMPGHSAGSIGVTVETDDGLSVITGDALHYADVARTGVNPLIFWDAEMANDSIRRAVTMADVLYPGHDHPFRMTRSGEVEYTEINEITLIGASPQTPGVHLLPAAPVPLWLMPGIEEQASSDRPSNIHRLRGADPDAS